jgi:hypothetical protein
MFRESRFFSSDQVASFCISSWTIPSTLSEIDAGSSLFWAIWCGECGERTGRASLKHHAPQAHHSE